ncbi:hypothetical protein [Embleya sp. NPDC059237]|uniref:hypothetical protein n=1 Tax=Embleya sp. NPDC059237 TaxID=3346784 RepID=UPI0036CA9683
MSRSKVASVGIACTAGAFAAVLAMSGTANALPPESRGVHLTCVDINSNITYSTNGAGTLSSSDPGAPNAQKMKLTSSITAPLNIPANSLTTTILMQQVNGPGSYSFSGTANLPMNAGNPITLGPVPAVGGRLSTPLQLILKDTSAAAPSATNYSVRIQATFAGTAADIRCAGSQDIVPPATTPNPFTF